MTSLIKRHQFTFFFFLTRSETVTSDRTNEEMGEESESLACRGNYIRAKSTLLKKIQAPVPSLAIPTQQNPAVLEE